MSCRDDTSLPETVFHPNVHGFNDDINSWQCFDPGDKEVLYAAHQEALLHSSSQLDTLSLTHPDSLLPSACRHMFSSNKTEYVVSEM